MKLTTISGIINFMRAKLRNVFCNGQLVLLAENWESK